MKRLWTLAVLLAVTAPASAHFVWILPPEKDGKVARVVFSDSLQPDKPELLKKIAHTELFMLNEEGTTIPVKFTKGEDALEVALPQGSGGCLLGGICHFGVVQRGQAEPFLLLYYPKSAFGSPTNKERAGEVLMQNWDKLPLQVVITKGFGFRVL